MIPKIVHYCWLSGDEYPKDISEYINEWKNILPKDTEFILWDSKMYDEIPNKPKWVIKAYEKKRWAFVSDYIRQYAVYTYGGWYLDSDVKVYIDFISKYYNTDYEFISSIEDSLDFYGGFTTNGNYKFGIGIEAAWFGGKKGNKVCKAVLDEYNTNKLFEVYSKGIKYKFLPLAPQIIAKIMEKFGFEYIKKEQQLDNILLLKNAVLNNIIYLTSQTIAIHMCVSSWRNYKYDIL